MSRIMLVDSQPAIRRAVAELLAPLRHTLVAEADNGADALNLFRQEQPELVIVELAGEHLGGLELLRRLRARSQDVRLLVYSSQDAQLFARLCLQAGADGYVGKHEAMAQLASGIKVVLGGRRFFPRDALDVRQQPARQATTEQQELQHLSAREITVLQLLAQGHSNQDIANQLAISFKTVSTYKTRLLEKLHASSLVELASIARRNGLAVPDVHALPDNALSSEQQQQLHLLQAMVDGSPFAMFMRDRQGRLVLCNQHFLQQNGATQADIGTLITQAHWFPAEHTQRMQTRYLQCAERGESYGDDVLVNLHGQPRVLHMWCVPYRDQQGQLLGMVGGSQDLSEQEHQIASLRAANAQAQADSARKNQLLRFFARELQNSAKALVPTRQRQLELLLSLETDGLTAQPQALEVGALTAQILASFAAGLGRAVPLHMEADASVWIDPLRYQQLLHNLLMLAPPQQLQALQVLVERRSGGRIQLRIEVEWVPPAINVQSLEMLSSASLTTHLGGVLALAESAVAVTLWLPAVVID